MKSLLRKLFARGADEPRRVLLHCHVFKNAGSTIDDALQRVYCDAFFDHRQDHLMQKQGMAYVEEFLENHPTVRALSSHHMPFAPDHLSEDFLFQRIVMLREPIDRAGSVHAFEQKQKTGTSGARMASEVGARQYFEWRLGNGSPAVVRSFQARYLAGRRKPKLPLSDEMLRIACERLEHPAVSFGIVERFDESMVVIEQRLRREFPELDLAHVVRNRNREGDMESRRAALRELIGDALFARLQEANAGDLELYRQANARLDEMIGRIPDFDTRLAEYKERCAGL